MAEITSGGGMQYPAWEKRVALLRQVYEWIKQRDAANNFEPIVTTDDVAQWAASIEGMSKVEAVYGLKQLVDEGYLTLVHMEAEISPEPWLMLVPQSLTEKGLLTIGEMPDPQERLVLGLEAAIRAIQKDTGIEEEEKKRRIDILEETKQIGRPLAVEVIKGMFRGEIPFL